MASVMTPQLERLVTELWHAAERFIRIVYIETDVLFTRSPHDRHACLLAAARSRNPAEMREAVTQHLRSNEREVADSLNVILGKSSSD